MLVVAEPPGGWNDNKEHSLEIAVCVYEFPAMSAALDWHHIVHADPQVVTYPSARKHATALPCKGEQPKHESNAFTNTHRTEPVNLPDC